MQAITEQAAKEGHVGDHAKIGIVTVSDRASQGVYVDEGGPALLSFLEQVRSSCKDLFQPPTPGK